jgi:hypothetical protein
MMTRAADCVRQLISLAGAPAVPGIVYDWPAIEASIGLRLPEDYKLLAGSLPPGWFRRFARLLYPGQSGPFLPPDISGQLDVMREWRAEGDAGFPYPIFPEPGGLLPWGEAVEGAMLFWLTGPGDPDSWPVITATAQWEHWERFDGTACEFLTEVAAGRYDTSHFCEGPVLQVMDAAESHITAQPIELAGRGPVFTPDPPRPAPAPPSGTRPDFWPRRVLDLGSDRAPVNEFPALAKLAGAAPAGVAPVDWAAVHARLGVRLPSDYRAFAGTYGAGTFGDVRIAVPGAGGDLDLFALLERKAAQIRGLPRHEWQAPLYPEPGGTICWGEMADGHTCGWAPAGTDPDQWGVVVIFPTRELSSFDFNPGITFSTALKEYKLYAEQHPGLALGLLPPRDPKAGPITFTPGQPA